MKRLQIKYFKELPMKTELGDMNTILVSVDACVPEQIREGTGMKW